MNIDNNSFKNLYKYNELFNKKYELTSTINNLELMMNSNPSNEELKEEYAAKLKELNEVDCKIKEVSKELDKDIDNKNLTKENEINETKIDVYEQETQNKEIKGNNIVEDEQKLKKRKKELTKIKERIKDLKIFKKGLIAIGTIAMDIVLININILLGLVALTISSLIIYKKVIKSFKEYFKERKLLKETKYKLKDLKKCISEKKKSKKYSKEVKKEEEKEIKKINEVDNKKEETNSFQVSDKKELSKEKETLNELKKELIDGSYSLKKGQIIQDKVNIKEICEFYGWNNTNPTSQKEKVMIKH